MKQTIELTVPQHMSDMTDFIVAAKRFRWLKSLYRHIRYSAGHSLLLHYRNVLITGAATLVISTVFLTASYLFLVQLAEHGW